MINLSDIEQVKVLKSNLRATFETGAGLETLKFLEQLCGWYDFHDIDPNVVLIKHGKRQVLATIKTLLDSTPEQVVALTKEQ